MKKILLSVITGALFLVGSLSMISMTPAAGPGCAQFANEFADELEELGIDHGEYVSACNVCTNKGQGKGQVGVCECKSFLLFIGDYSDLEEGFGITNFGSCVNYVKDFYDAQ